MTKKPKDELSYEEHVDAGHCYCCKCAKWVSEGNKCECYNKICSDCKEIFKQGYAKALEDVDKRLKGRRDDYTEFSKQIRDRSMKQYFKVAIEITQGIIKEMDFVKRGKKMVEKYPEIKELKKKRGGEVE